MGFRAPAVAPRPRSSSASAAAADAPAGAASAAPPPAGRSLQLCLRLLNQPPAQPERLGDGVVRRLKADADKTSVLELE